MFMCPYFGSFYELFKRRKLSEMQDY